MKTSLLAAVFLLGLLVGIGLSGRCQDYLIVNGIAQHLGHESHCHNHVTPGIGFEHPFSESWRLAIGAYSNSNCSESAYIAGAWLPLRYGALRLGTITGLVTGYRTSPAPAGGFVAVYERRDWKVNLILIPPADESGNGVLWLQFGVALN